jgi:23S rRNA pseudouridine1911/1915/1917 synthase
MPYSKQISFCLFKNTSLENLLNDLNISRSKLKKHHLSKKNLQICGGELNLPLDLINDLEVNPNYFRNDCYILYEDENLVALHKPHNLHSHPLRYNEWDNCLSFLRNINRSELLEVNKKHYDRGLLYRLDFGTSGVLIFSKRESEINNFRVSPKYKYYLAIVQGRIDATFHYQHFIDYVGQKKRKARATVSEITNSEIAGKVLAFNQKRQLSLVLVQLNEGKRHQIRAQLSSSGYPIYGDVLYGGTPSERLFLHAYNYQFNFCDKEYDLLDKEFIFADRYFDMNQILK